MIGYGTGAVAYGSCACFRPRFRPRPPYSAVLPRVVLPPVVDGPRAVQSVNPCRPIRAVQSVPPTPRRPTPCHPTVLPRVVLPRVVLIRVVLPLPSLPLLWTAPVPSNLSRPTHPAYPRRPA